MIAQAATPAREVVVLCPMAIERQAIARAVRRTGRRDVQVMQTGIGKEAVMRTLQSLMTAAGKQPPKLIILAGACGGLRSVADVPPIARVIDEHGRHWTPADGDPQGVTLIGMDRIISSPSEKTQLAERTGAAIVDMESHAFIEACERLGVAWAIVRGVSDTPEETLPTEVMGWIDPGGDTRNGRAAMDLLRRPRLLLHVVPVLRRSRRVLPQVGSRVVELIQRHSGAPA